MEGNNVAKKTVIAIKRAYYRDVTPEMMAKVKSDSMLDNATQHAGIISNLFRNPSDPVSYTHLLQDEAVACIVRGYN